MEKIYLVIVTKELDGYYQEPIKAFADKEKADFFAKQYDVSMKKKINEAAKRDIKVMEEINQLSILNLKKTIFENENKRINKNKISELWNERNELAFILEYNSIEVIEIDFVK